MYSRVAMQRLKEHNPAAQVVLVLREPIDRAYSEYWYARRRGWESGESFEAACRRQLDGADSDPLQRIAYLARSQYVDHVEMVFDTFPRSQVHVFLFEDLKADPVSICRNLFRTLLNVDVDFTPATPVKNAAATVWSRSVRSLLTDSQRLRTVRAVLRRMLSPGARQAVQSSLLAVNERSFTPPALRQQTREWLAEHFAPWNHRLERTIDKNLDVWMRAGRSPIGDRASGHRCG
jgi:hypothetical protein